MADLWRTTEPHPRDTSLWAIDFGPRVGRTEADARLRLAEDIALISPEHVFIIPPKEEGPNRGISFLWAHVVPADAV